MLEFLSEAWLHALDVALRASNLARAGASFVIEQVVREVPGRGEVRYRLVVDGTGARVDRTIGEVPTGPTGPAGSGSDFLRLTTDYATAVAIASGRENAQRALAAGRLRVGGDVGVLLRHGDAFAAVGDVTGALRSDTTFPPP